MSGSNKVVSTKSLFTTKHQSIFLSGVKMMYGSQVGELLFALGIYSSTMLLATDLKATVPVHRSRMSKELLPYVFDNDGYGDILPQMMAALEGMVGDMVREKNRLSSSGRSDGHRTGDDSSSSMVTTTDNGEKLTNKRQRSHRSKDRNKDRNKNRNKNRNEQSYSSGSYDENDAWVQFDIDLPTEDRIKFENKRTMLIEHFLTSYFDVSQDQLCAVKRELKTSLRMYEEQLFQCCMMVRNKKENELRAFKSNSNGESAIQAVKRLIGDFKPIGFKSTTSTTND